MGSVTGWLGAKLLRLEKPSVWSDIPNSTQEMMLPEPGRRARACRGLERSADRYFLFFNNQRFFI